MEPQVTDGNIRTSGLRGIRVLIVDDEADCRALFTTALTIEGAEVRQASNGAEALRVAEEFRPDVVVSDIMMPVLDGYGFLREFRARPFGSAPVVAISASGRAGEAARAAGSGFALYIEKPVQIEEFLETIARISST